MRKKYSDIAQELYGLPRVKQYELLLNTRDWYEFRQKVIDRDLGKCVECDRSAGPVYEYRCSEEEYRIENQEAFRKTKIWEEFVNTNQHVYIEFLATGKHSELIPEQGVVYPREKQVGEIILQVHHSLYFYDKLPWQYQLKYMKTLCGECHTKFHQNNQVYLYKDESMEFRRVTQFCWKCNGSGVLPEFYYFQEGVCFECGGLGFSLDDSHAWEKLVE